MSVRKIFRTIFYPHFDIKIINNALLKAVSEPVDLSDFEN